MSPTALTGSPGTGKSAAAWRLRAEWPVEEVGDLAQRLGTARSRSRVTGRAVEVDLDRTRRAVLRNRAEGSALWVGHLAHLLPVRDVVLLRCHPRELARRLTGRGDLRARDLRQNLLVEATDVILAEALSLGRRIWEIDTTGRSPEAVARSVASRLRRKGPPSYGRIDWLADPWVTEHLLEWAR